MEAKNTREIIYAGSFVEAISPTLCISQILGIFPLKGIWSGRADKFQFSWFSISTLICLAFIIWDGVVIVTHTYFHRYSKITSGIISGTIFFTMALLIYLGFLLLAMRWVRLMKWWTEKEQRFLQPPYISKYSKQLKSRLITVSSILTFLATAEHALHQGSSIFINMQIKKHCNITNEGVQEFLFKRFPFVHLYIPGMFAMVLSQLVSLLGTVAWNFLDLFIILICIGIRTRFDQITSALENHLKNNIPDEKSMLKFRLDFIAACEILEYAEKHLGIFIFLSTVNNVYFICGQIMNAFNGFIFFLESFYYWFSLLYLISRTLYLFLSAAAINESARSPINLIHGIPQEHWNKESDRLFFQITSCPAALSAMGFFHFTRGLILTVAGAILTFELVLMQFGSTVYQAKSVCGVNPDPE